MQNDALKRLAFEYVSAEKGYLKSWQWPHIESGKDKKITNFFTIIALFISLTQIN